MEIETVQKIDSKYNASVVLCLLCVNKQMFANRFVMSTCKGGNMSVLCLRPKINAESGGTACHCNFSNFIRTVDSEK